MAFLLTISHHFTDVSKITSFHWLKKVSCEIPQADKFDITDYTSYKYAYHIKKENKKIK